MANDKLVDFKIKLEQHIKAKILPEYVYSYPPKRAFRKFIVPLTVRDVWYGYNRDLNIYVHIPFCKYRCTYCTIFACTKYTNEFLDSYINQICNEIAFYSKYLNEANVRTLYFGGGTPTLLTGQQLGAIIKSIRKYFPNIDPNIEITIEGTPESYTNEVIDNLLNYGINRVSIGVQSFNNEELRLSGRKTQSWMLKKSLEEITSKFENVNMDLIYGLPSQNRTTWFKSLKTALTYKPSIISLYPVVCRSQANISTLYNKKTYTFLTDAEKYDIYDKSVILLAKNGYKQHSFTRFSLHDKSSYLQETLDFKGIPLLGIGVGARSYNGKFHYSCNYSSSLNTAYEIVTDFLHSDYKGNYNFYYGTILKEEELERRYVILNLTLGELNLDEYIRLFPSANKEEIKDFFKVLINNKLITIRENTIRLTSLGFKYSNLIARLFFSDEVLELEKKFT